MGPLPWTGVYLSLGGGSAALSTILPVGLIDASATILAWALLPMAAVYVAASLRWLTEAKYPGEDAADR